jgi:hypothetical protein
MFGWKLVEREPKEHPTFGVRLEMLRSGQWLVVFFGRRAWHFTRYTLNRHTGPAENRAVLGSFLGGPERRTKGRDFYEGFGRAAAKPILTADEIRRRNREQTIAKPLPYAWPGAEMRPGGGVKLR